MEVEKKVPCFVCKDLKGFLERNSFFFPQFFKKKKNFIHLWLCWVFNAVQDFLCLRRVGVALQLQCAGLSLRWFLLLQSTGSRVYGLQQLLHVGSVVVVPGFQSTGSITVVRGLAAPRHVRSSCTRDRTCVSCIGRQILYHRATREALKLSSYLKDLAENPGLFWIDLVTKIFHKDYQIFHKYPVAVLNHHLLR